MRDKMRGQKKNHSEQRKREGRKRYRSEADTIYRTRILWQLACVYVKDGETYTERL